jgi:hypothetical protein
MQPLDLGGLKGQIPASWTPQPLQGEFRRAQLLLPAVKPDTIRPFLLVTHFGAEGAGSVEDNVRRWIGMVKQPDGGDSAKLAKRTETERNGIKILTFDLSGTYMERARPADPTATERPGYRLLTAIVQATGPKGDGPYYFRLFGPAKSVEAAKPAWDAMLASLR